MGSTAVCILQVNPTAHLSCPESFQPPVLNQAVLQVVEDLSAVCWRKSAGFRLLEWHWSKLSFFGDFSGSAYVLVRNFLTGTEEWPACLSEAREKVSAWSVMLVRQLSSVPHCQRSTAVTSHSGKQQQQQKQQSNGDCAGFHLEPASGIWNVLVKMLGNSYRNYHATVSSCRLCC